MASSSTSSDGLTAATEVTPGQEGGLQGSTTGDVVVVETLNGDRSLAKSPSLSSSTSALPPASRAARRSCTTSGCRRAMGSASSDPHTVCIFTVDKRCPECAEWRPAMMAGAYKYQLALQRKRNYIAKRKVTQSTVSPPRCSPGASQGSVGHSVIIQDEVASVRDSVGPEDSVSRATLPRPSFPGEINQIFSDFATFFLVFLKVYNIPLFPRWCRT